MLPRRSLRLRDTDLLWASLGVAVLVAACGGSGGDEAVGGGPASAGSSGAHAGGSGAGQAGKSGAAGTASAGTGGAAKGGAAGAAGGSGVGGAGASGASGAGAGGKAGQGGAAGLGGAAGGAGTAGGGGAPVPDAIVLEPAAASLTVEIGGQETQVFKVSGFFGGTKKDITGTCALSLGDPDFGSFTGAIAFVKDHPGQTAVTATCGAKTASGTLSVTVHGGTIDPTVPQGTPAVFAGAKTSNDPGAQPKVEYPLDGSVTPKNMPAPVAQWSTPLGLHHLQVKGPNVVFDVYTSKKEASLPAEHWKMATQAAAGSALTFTVESLVDNTDPPSKVVSAPVSHLVSPDAIAGTTIYWWASSKGALVYQTFGNTGAPSTLKADCTSCHSLSRSGTRLGYSRCVGNNCSVLKQGFMRFDQPTSSWVETVDANNQQIPGSYSTFAPVGNPFPDDSKAAAIVALSNSHLELYDPDSGAVLPSNIQGASVAAGATATMPDWSPDGKLVALATTPQLGNWIDVSGARLATMTYSYAGGTHTFGNATKLFDALDIPQGHYDNFFFPSFSPDGSVLVANGARSAWRNFSTAAAAGQRLFLADPKGGWIVDLSAANGPGDLDITWPRWAPLTTGQHLWVLFASERDYGHLLTLGNTSPACVQNGVKQCKQLWIAAIDKAKLPGPGGVLTIDPSFPPVWLPGQDLGANNISPTWTVPPVKN